jgi:hypothetical protein
MVNSLIVALAGVLVLPVTYAADPSSEGLTRRAERLESDARPAPSKATLTIPAQTEAAVQLLSGIHTQVSHVGDPVTARLLQPVYIGGRIALPTGSVINGRITRVRSAGRMLRSGELALRFDRITLPDGQDQSIVAGLSALDDSDVLKTRVDSEGHLKGSKGFSWKSLAGGFIGLGGLAALHSQLAGAAALGTTLPIGGGAMLGYTFLWRRGNEVHVPPETHLRIRLDRPLTIRVAW